MDSIDRCGGGLSCGGRSAVGDERNVAALTVDSGNGQEMMKLKMAVSRSVHDFDNDGDECFLERYPDS